MKTAIFRWVLLAAAVLFIVLGIINGDPRSVMAKAVRICMECIGLG
ncbi:MAG: thioredoxin [Clostridia bacterium]|nr:thioredoxin [Clostridia bacterium]